MTTLLKNGKVVNVFTDELEEKNVLIEDGRIIGVGAYDTADTVVDVAGKYICPGFIDGHIHIESTMLLPGELARVCVPHGTSAIIADPHEIANVCGTTGISYMMETSAGLPMDVYFMLPSCVPATGLDESGAELSADDLEPFYSDSRVLGLAEMMNYPGAVAGDPGVIEKIKRAAANGRIINGHAPLLSGTPLDRYISAGIRDDHECTGFDEAVERIQKGQRVMVREGTSARNLEGLIGLFDEPYNRRCMLVTDDKHPFDLLTNGHIDAIIRKAVRMGKSALTGIRMATIQAAEHFGLKNVGAVAPGYIADLLVLDDLDTVAVRDVYHGGVCVCRAGQMLSAEMPEEPPQLSAAVRNTFNIAELSADDFRIEPETGACRVIRVLPGELLTQEEITGLDTDGTFSDGDVIKLAVCERHKATGHIGLGYIAGLGIRRGAIASSVSHDSHNLIIAGANDADMALAGNTVAQMNGGLCVVCGGKVLARMPLPVAGLMTDESAAAAAEQNRLVREAAETLGTAGGVEPFMNLAFISLPVIPSLKMTTRGLVRVESQELVPLFVK